MILHILHKIKQPLIPISNLYVELKGKLNQHFHNIMHLYTYCIYISILKRHTIVSLQLL